MSIPCCKVSVLLVTLVERFYFYFYSSGVNEFSVHMLSLGESHWPFCYILTEMKKISSTSFTAQTASTTKMSTSMVAGSSTIPISRTV